MKLENDKERIQFLLSPIKDTGNSQSYQNKLEFWKSKILEECSKKKIGVFDFQSLKKMMVLDNRYPMCLDFIVNYMLKEGSLRTLSEFKLSCAGWLSWSACKFIKKPISWTFSTLFKEPLVSTFNWLKKDEPYNFDLYSSQQLQLPHDHFVIPQIIHNMADEIFERHNQQMSLDITDNIINYNIFQRRCKDIAEDTLSFDLAIEHLCSQKRCQVITTKDDKFIVMADKKQSASISGNEQKIYRLKMMEHKLQKQVDKLEQEIVECTNNAKELLKKKQKKSALSLLKKKKSLEGLMDKKHASIEKVSHLLSMIQQTDHNKQMVDAVTWGVEAFKGMRENTGLSEERVDDVMMDVQEALDQHEEINQAISRPTNVSDWPDEDLELELNDIIANEKAEKQLEELNSLLDLPPVPHGEPEISPRIKRKSKMAKQ